MAFTNGDGAHVDIELAAPYTLGTSHTYRYQEASFYGNVFLDKPAAFYCVGKDYAKSGSSIRLLETRSCLGYNEKDGTCPYVRAGYCNSAFSLNFADNTINAGPGVDSLIGGPGNDLLQGAAGDDGIIGGDGDDTIIGGAGND
jgi:Ca2+-binding RTX toxin-like protein